MNVHLTNITGCIVSLSDCLIFENYDDKYLKVEYCTDYDIEDYLFKFDSIPENIKKIFDFSKKYSYFDEYNLIGTHIRKKTIRKINIITYLSNPLYEHFIDINNVTNKYNSDIDDYCQDMLDIHKI